MAHAMRLRLKTIKFISIFISSGCITIDILYNKITIGINV